MAKACSVRRLTVLVLAWFLLSLAASIASPIVSPKRMELLCGEGTGARMVVIDDDGDAVPMGDHSLDCPLCLVSNAPPAVYGLLVAPAKPEFHYLRRRTTALHVVASVGAPLPPRGPPASF